MAGTCGSSRELGSSARRARSAERGRSNGDFCRRQMIRTRLMESSLEELLTRYHLFPQEELVARFYKYLALLQKWNRRMNLTASTDWAVLRPFFEEAIWASSFYPDGPVRHLDVGSGAGFPAVIIRIVKERMLLDLLERRSKRAVFLQTAIHELELSGLDGSQPGSRGVLATVRRRAKCGTSCPPRACDGAKLSLFCLGGHGPSAMALSWKRVSGGQPA